MRCVLLGGHVMKRGRGVGEQKKLKIPPSAECQLSDDTTVILPITITMFMFIVESYVMPSYFTQPTLQINLFRKC